MKKTYLYNPASIRLIVESPKTDIIDYKVFVHLESGISFCESGKEAEELMAKLKAQRPDMFPKPAPTKVAKKPAEPKK